MTKDTLFSFNIVISLLKRGGVLYFLDYLDRRNLTMKRIKYIFALVLFLITFSFIGESYIFYLDNFSEEFYKTTMYKPDYITDEKMKLDIKQSVKKHNVGVYAVKEEKIGRAQVRTTVT